MKTIRSEIRRALTGRWFLAAVFASAATLWLSAGWQTQMIAEALRYAHEPEMCFQPDWTGFMNAALTGELGLLVLPAVSSLPFAAEALLEIRGVAFRPAMFRTGRRMYMAGKIAACAVSGAAVQLGGCAVLAFVLEVSCLLRGLGWQEIPVIGALAGRMLCGGLWACVGCALSLMTETPGAAYLAPLCLCCALRMIGTRFFPEMAWMDAAAWPCGHPLLPGGMLMLSAAAAATALNREVARHA